MKKSVLNKINNLLLKEKEILLAKNNHNDDVDVDGDEVDEIQGTLLASISNQLTTRDKIKLNQIASAFKRMEDDTFGICEDCEELISEKRLEANPYVATCIGCAEMREFEEKQRRRV